MLKIFKKIIINKLIKYSKYILSRYQLFVNYEGITMLDTIGKNRVKNYLYDINLYEKYSIKDGIPENFTSLKARITAHYHAVEKGMAYDKPRPGFGIDLVISLCKHITRYTELGYTTSDGQFQSSLVALRDYVEYHENTDININEIKCYFEKFKKYLKQENKCFREVKANDLINCTKGNFEELANNRFSIRSFSEKEVPIEILVKAIHLAGRTPSVCNRQAWNTLIIKEKEKISEVLSFQNGNRGFGNTINKLLIVTMNLSCFYSIEERNQAFIDGGLYSMSLVYALNYYGLGTVVLNWATDFEHDKKLKGLLGIAEDNVVICFIGTGYYLETFKVTLSQRKNINEIHQIIS